MQIEALRGAEGALVDRGGGEGGRDGRERAAQRLAEHQHVGREALGLVGEEGPGAAEDRLDLVEDEEGAASTAEMLRARQIAGRREHHAALAEDGLDDERAYLAAGEGAIEGVEIAEGDLVAVGEERREGRPHAGHAGHRERAQGEAVVAPRAEDDAGRGG